MNRINIIFLAAAAGLAGCSSTPDASDIAKEQVKSEAIITSAAQEKAEAKISSVPEWFLAPPKNDNAAVYGTGSGESRKLDVAMKKADLNAQYELARSLSQELSGNEQSYTRESSSTLKEQYTRLIDSIVASVPVNGYETLQQKVVAENGQFSAYKLLRLSYERFSQTMENLGDTGRDEIKATFEDLQKRLKDKKEQISEL